MKKKCTKIEGEGTGRKSGNYTSEVAKVKYDEHMRKRKPF